MILVPAAAAASLLSCILQPHSSTLMTVLQPSELQWVENLLKMKLGNSCEIFIPRVQCQEKICSSWVFHFDDQSESSSKYDMIIGCPPRPSS
jgi:hypothetical protein